MPKAPKKPSTTPVKAEKPKFPSEIVELPSKGLLYPEGHPLSEGTIEIKYMTAREEDILTSANLIQKGVVVDELLKSIIMTDVPYNDLLIGDKNAVMLSARIFGYGKEYECDVTCPSCSAIEKDCEFDLTSLDYKEIDDQVFSDGNKFSFVLPNSTRMVEFRFLTQKEESGITKELERVNKHMKGVSPEITTRLRYQIISIDGDDSKEAITNFINNELFAVDSRAFREHYADSMPDVDFDVGYTCGDCGVDSVIELPISVNFFWPSR